MAKATLAKDTKWKTTIEVRGHEFVADEPTERGGTDLGPTPTELLASSLASCSAITMQMYAGRKEWPLDEVSVDVTIEQRKDDTGKRTAFVKRLSMAGDLSQEQVERLKQISSKCPIHKLLAEAHIMETHVD